MKSPWLVHSIFLLQLCLLAIWDWELATADELPAQRSAGCQSKCGNVDIPYPFGIGDQCAIHHGFDINCKAVDGTERPFKGPFEVTKISVADAKAWMKMNISWRCYGQTDTRNMREYMLMQNFINTPFRFSETDNKIFVLGCYTTGYMTTLSINHKNIVKLFGCCLEVEVPMLVYEFIPHGTLFQLIHGNHGRQISLATRMQIAHQSAEALAYLHSCASPPILHGDVKSSNILIDSDYAAKVSDFGASILAPTDESQFVTLVQGTCGYLDPEYMQTCQLTDKSDVYSFGVVLLELLTRKKPLNLEGPEHEKSLALRFISVAKEGKLEEILDDQIMNDENMDVLEEVADLAKQCLEMSGENRPSMKEVSERLDRSRKVMSQPWAQQNIEEMESLLGESSMASSEVLNTGNLSIEKAAAKGLEWGR
nr:unnamed protein product [Digitaria exilis]